jgi:Acyl-CoA thioester hydrolase/BAAT N-terminal region
MMGRRDSLCREGRRVGRRWRQATVGLTLCLLAGACQQEPDRPPVLRVDRPTALIDQPVRVTVYGLAASQTVTVRAQASDHAKQTWASWARFTADDRGTVDLATAAPRAGTYSGADPMGLFWSLQPPTGHDPRTTDFDWSIKEPLPITLAAETNGASRASRRLVRLQAANGVQRRPLREHGLVGALYTTTARRPRPTVLVLGGSEAACTSARRRCSPPTARRPWPTSALLACHANSPASPWSTSPGRPPGCAPNPKPTPTGSSSWATPAAASWRCCSARPTRPPSTA